MYRILIVDDEHHVVNWVSSLLEQADLNLEVLKAYKGSDALKILTEHRIDIVLLDIKMPGLNGLQVADYIHDYWPSCRIIFLTGFNDFDFIYKANKMKHTAYLLKTEEDHVLLAEIASTIHDIEKEHRLQLQNKIAHQKDFLLQYWPQKEFIKDLLAGKTYDKVAGSLQLTPCSINLEPSRPVYLAFCHVKWKDSLSEGEMLHLNHILMLNQTIEIAIQEYFQYASIDLSRNNFLFLFQKNNGNTTTAKPDPTLFLKESFNAAAAQLQHSISTLLCTEEVSWPSLVSVYESLQDYFTSLINRQNLSQSYTYAVTPKMLSSLAPSDISSKSKTFIQKALHDFSHDLYQGEFSRCRISLRELQKSYTQSKSMHSLPLIELYFSISTHFMKYIVDYNLNEAISTFIGLYPLYFINEFDTWDKAFDYLCRLISVLEQLNQSSEKDTTQRLIDTIKQYITEHLNSELTLTDLSEAVNYNPSYLSRIFKKQTGISLFDYINAERISRAKLMLRDTDLPINQIADTIGFDTSQYFSIVFKKTVGISPREYRQQHLI